MLWPLADPVSEATRTLAANRAFPVPNRKNSKLFIWYDNTDSAEKHFGLLLNGILISLLFAFLFAL